MDRALFAKLCQSDYADYVSFAIWNDADVTDVGVISENIDLLTTATIVVGLNSTRDNGHFGNYHKKYRGCRDAYLRAGFQYPGCPFRGSYMTDLVHDSRSTDQGQVQVTGVHVTQLINELKFIGMAENRSPFVIALGGKVHRHLRELGFCEAFRSTFGVEVAVARLCHHGGHGLSKTQFVDAIKTLGTHYTGTPTLNTAART